MRITVLRERAAAETVRKLVALGASVAIESGASERASLANADYVAAGATVGSLAATVAGAEIELGVQGPDPASLAGAANGARIVAALNPLGEPRRVDAYASGGYEALAMEFMPRITRA